MKQKMISDILLNGRIKTWFEYAEMYNIKSDSKFREVRTKAANDIWRNYLRKQKRKNKLAKVLVFDIETAPLSSYVWRAWNNSIYNNDMFINSEWLTLSWSAKWIHNSKIMNSGVNPQEIKEENDLRLVQQLWRLFDVADIVIAHNAWNYDVRMMNARFLKYGLDPPSPYKVIDTLKVAKQAFRLPKYSLTFLCEYLKLGSKIDTEFKLWKRVLQGEKQAMKEMLEYNDEDIILLEKLYFKLRPWIKNHPNVNLFLDINKSNCPTCGSRDLLYNGEYMTAVNKYTVMQCQNCGSNSRQRKNNSDTKKLLKSL